MAYRERPFHGYNFLVDFGVDPASPQAGFQEVSGIALEVSVTEYRNGNERENAPRKITGLVKVPDVTLKRGIIGDPTLYEWINAVRNGSQDERRTVTITLQSEDRTTNAQSWKLIEARAIKLVTQAFKGTGAEIAVQELTIASERIEEEF
jgi:phage tail-like protein